MSVFMCIIVTTVFILNCLHCICSVCVFVCVHISYIWLFILVSFVCVAADLKQRKLESWEWQLDASWTWSHTHHWHHGHVCMIVVYCNYTIHVFTHNTCMHLPSACMHTSLACSIRCSWCGYNVASDNYRVKSACNQNGMSQWKLPCTQNHITVLPSTVRTLLIMYNYIHTR